jgi:hypothetical protein|tara:strand:- start:788 stop:1102 length:315 start_codon:yes stop_codon:yes gene_type:complete
MKRVMVSSMKNLVSKTTAKELIKKHNKLTHSENVKVVSHVQREAEDWVMNTLMIDNIDVPFKYKRKKHYKSLQGYKVNITYYPDEKSVAGFIVEVMSVVRVKIS